MTEQVIRTDALSRSFGKIRAVDNLSLEVPAGVVYGFLGPNGSGKTTTIRMLLGLLRPSGGSAEVLGFSVDSRSDQIRQRCGTLLEHAGLYERLTVEENLEFIGRAWHMRRGDRRERTNQLLARFSLSERRKDAAGKLSRGMKQKLAIARAVYHRPRLVFLDEPTNGLDAPSAAALRQDILQLTGREGTTVFLTTHNLQEAEKLCSRIAVIRSGRLIFSGSPRSLREGVGRVTVHITAEGLDKRVLEGLKNYLPEESSPQQERDMLEFTLPPGGKAAPVVEFLVQQGVAVEEVRKGNASLEEAFLEILKPEEEKV